MPVSRYTKDWIVACENGTDPTSTPLLFRRWAAISAVAGALGRRCWYDFGTFRCYPNMYIGLIGASGSNKSLSMRLPLSVLLDSLALPLGISKEEAAGKQAALAELGFDFTETKPIRVLQDKITPEKLLVDMESATHMDPYSSIDNPVYDSSLTMVTSEFGVLMSRENSNLQAWLTDFWDAKDKVSYRIKTGPSQLIRGAALNWIFGSVPETFVTNMPKDATEQGLTSRIIAVHYDGPAFPKKAYYPTVDAKLQDELRKDLADIAQTRGEFKLGPKVKEFLDDWFGAGMPPEPNYPLMESYNTRRHSHFMKVAQCVAAARHRERVIMMADVELTQTYLLEAEANMVKVISKFGLSESGQLVSNIRKYIDQQWRNGGENWPVPEDKTREFALRTARAAAEVDQILKAMEEADIIRKINQNDVTGFAPGDNGKFEVRS